MILRCKNCCYTRFHQRQFRTVVGDKNLLQCGFCGILKPKEPEVI